MAEATSIWKNSGLRAYLGATAFSGMALAMQQLLVSWLLIGTLQLPADQVGIIQALIGIPGIIVMLVGGASADRRDARSLLIKVYLFAPVLPLYLVFVEQSGLLGVTHVTLFGLGMGFVMSYSTPAQQAILNRVSGDDVQQVVTGATAIGFGVQVAGLILAGQMDRIGITPVLLLQSVGLGLACVMTMRIAKQSPRSQAAPSPVREIAAGLVATYRDKVIFALLSINFVSSIFNAGSFITVYPFIIKRIYDGDAFILSLLMATFFAGAAVSNAILLRFMPLRFPGRLFLLMQLSRIVVLLLVWIKLDWWLLVLATLGWGLNMGVTTNLARTIVQESAEPAFRGRVLSVVSVGMIGSASIGAILLGWLIETVGTANALIPAMVVSFALFIIGILFTRIWAYESRVG
jgi:predicted MFS family arabinose efflux permease